MSSGLTPLDATFLELEEADSGAHMHIGSLLVFEARDGTPPTIGRLRRHLESRMGGLRRHRLRLSEPHTGGFHWPVWEEDPDFRLEQHVERAALPAPGGEAELLDWAADYWSRRLDRRRPLWHACLVTGLEDGRWALASKTHHAMVDGVGSMDVAAALLDPVRRPRRRPQPPEPPPAAGANGRPGALGLLSRGLRGSLYAARHPGRLRDAFLQAKSMADVLVRDEVLPAPASSLNVPIGARRRYAVVRADLAELQEVRGALGGTVNDVLLAVVTGGLRELLDRRGDTLPGAGLRAMVPVNLRTAAERFGLGNRVSSLFLHLPVAEPDPALRYSLIRAGSERLKHSGQAGGGAAIVALAGVAPPVLHSLFARSALATRLFNLTVTNVPGPERPLYAFGARVEEMLPLVPLAADHAVGVAAVSYAGRVFLGLNADEATTPDLAVLPEGMEAALAELLDLAGDGHREPALT
jgi:WS/DGAT/MGAT family acyltransferase